MKRYTLYLFFVWLALGATGCRQQAPYLTKPQEQITSTWPEAFDAFWNGMNNSYAFWDVDHTDWDAVYDRYKPRFDSISEKNPTNDSLAAALFDELSSTLIDHHMSLTIKGSDGRIYSSSPSDHWIAKRSYYHPFGWFAFGTIRALAQENQMRGRIAQYRYGAYETDPVTHDTLRVQSYEIDGTVAYFGFSDFSLGTVLQAYTVGKDPKAQAVCEAFLAFQNMVNTRTDLKGVVIDVRANGGGARNDLSLLLGSWIDAPLPYGSEHTKSGLGRLDFEPWRPMVLQPSKGAVALKVPLVLLVDLHSVSMSEITAMVVQQMPTGCVVGERTWGGHGGLFPVFEAAFCGKFTTLCKTVSVYMSDHATKDMQGRVLEGIGITPNIEVLWNENEITTTGVDGQLERALTYIRTGR